ncbi:MAG: glycosyltransferase [Clostridia bacterium]|nr:glycosyltransferase [Clostridia bacterium]
MTVVQINATCTAGSTGCICSTISRLLDEKGIPNSILHTQSRNTHPRGIRYAGAVYLKLQALRSRVLGNYGFNSRFATRRLLRELDAIRPTVVHLHNLHGHNVHLGMLLDYLREKGIRTIWTFHDCWAFTAYCPHFAGVGCDQWRTRCLRCPLKRRYSWFFDRSRWLYARKKEAVRGLDLTVTVPSHWLGEIVKHSFFGQYPIRVLQSGIDLRTFKPTKSDFRKRYGLEDRKIVLGVANKWSIGKGVDVFDTLSGRLDHTCQIVLVGTDPKTASQLSEKILCLPRTADPAALAAIYTAADVFVNPTREETLGLTNLEALACGTPVITFASGGSPECVDRSCGVVVPCGDVEALLNAIRSVTRDTPFSREACINFAGRFDADTAFGETIKLYGLEHESTATKTI